MEHTLKKSQPINLTRLKRNSRKSNDRKSGHKKPRIGDCDVQPAPDSMVANSQPKLNPKSLLSVSEKSIIENGEWLTDESMTLANTIFSNQFPGLEGFQSPLLSPVKNDEGHWSLRWIVKMTQTVYKYITLVLTIGFCLAVPKTLLQCTILWQEKVGEDSLRV